MPDLELNRDSDGTMRITPREAAQLMRGAAAGDPRAPSAGPQRPQQRFEIEPPAQQPAPQQRAPVELYRLDPAGTNLAPVRLVFQPFPNGGVRLVLEQHTSFAALGEPIWEGVWASEVVPG